MLVTGGLQKRLMLVGEFYENVLQTWRKRADFRHGNAMVPELMAQALHIKTLVNERMDGLPENGGAANPGNMAGQPQGAGNFVRGDFHAHRPGRLDVRKLAKRIGRAVSNDLAIINLPGMAAAFRFIHVVRGHEKSDAVPGELGQP